MPWTELERHIASQQERCEGMAALDLEPDFQRAHVWTEAQQIAFVEYQLQGGTSGKELYFNCAGWGLDYRGPYVIVDGKQRLQAVRRFIANEIPAFGHLLSEYDDKLNFLDNHFNWNVAALESRTEVLQWYLNFNAGGTVHTAEELERVRKLISDAAPPVSKHDKQHLRWASNNGITSDAHRLLALFRMEK